MKNIRIDWTLVIFSISAALIGALSLYGGGGLGESLAIKHLIWLFIGIILMFIFAFVNYQKIGSFSIVLYGIGIFLLLITLIPGIGTKIKGAQSWIRFFGMGFQPAEFMKFTIIIALGKYLTLKESQIEKFQELALPFLITAVPMMLIAIQPDLGYSVMMIPLLIILLYVGGANVTILSTLVIVGFSTLFVSMYLEYHKYIITGDIVNVLREINFKLADAVRFLHFDVWQIVENPERYSTISDSGPAAWARTVLLEKENINLFFQTAEDIRISQPTFLRDFFSNSRLIIWISVITLLTYGVLFFLQYFYIRSSLIKNLAVGFLIVSLSLSSSFIFRKVVTFKPHQVVRIVSFANPDKFPKGAGYQLRHSLITLGSGQVTGKGLFAGDMTKGDVPFLPEWYNDFIYPVVGEQFGFVGAVGVLLLLFGIVFRGASIAWQSKDSFGVLLATGITAIFFLHIFINIGITMGLLPVTGIPLIFLSYGGSNMVVNFIGLGMLMNIHMRRFINA